eukprot:228718-Heterocapsa_arctica.AAC.1
MQTYGQSGGSAPPGHIAVGGAGAISYKCGDGVSNLCNRLIDNPVGPVARRAVPPALARLPGRPLPMTAARPHVAERRIWVE